MSSSQWDKSQNKRIRKEIKDPASETREKPMQIVSSAIERLDKEAKGFIGNVDSICWHVQKTQQTHFLVEPHSLAELQILASYKVTSNGD